jgi:Pvc16 N-terminal domain
MATSAGIAAVAKSVERLLKLRFAQDEPTTGTKPTEVELVTVDKLKSVDVPALTIYFYRVDINRTMRPGWSAVGHHDGVGHLPLDLHFLLTAWATNAEDELRIIGRAMELLESTPILTGPLLHSLNTNLWGAGESIQLLADEVPAETVMRVFDLWPVKHKLSVSYLARVMRLDTRPATPDLPVGTIVTGMVPSLTP